VAVTREQARRLAREVGAAGGDLRVLRRADGAGAGAVHPSRAWRFSCFLLLLAGVLSSATVVNGLSRGVGAVRPAEVYSMRDRTGVARVVGVTMVAMGVATGASAQVDAVEWRVEDGGNGHWYGVLTNEAGLDWDSARSASLERGADLGVLAGPAERNFVFQLAADVPEAWRLLSVTGHHWGPWVGAYQVVDSPEPGGGWRWIDESDSEVLLDESVTLNDQVACCGANEDRLFLYCLGDLGESDLIELNDIPWTGACQGVCNYGQRVHSAILEWSADCDQNGLVDYGEIVRGEKVDANANGVPDCCESPAGCCPGDVDGDGAVNGIDLAIVLARWGGPSKDYPKADADGSGVVDGVDLAVVLGAWGDCG
jgi:hypothetical protein